MKNLIRTFAVFALCLSVLSCSDDDDDNTTSTPQTIAAIASGNPNLSTLVSALNRTGLTATFNSAGDYTVFAPTNDKFAAFLSANGYANLEAVPVDALREILRNHVLGTSLTASELTTGYVKTLAKGSASTTNTLSMYVEVTAGNVKLNGGASNKGASVVTANINASNGVIHVVDNVIALPTVVNHAIANPNFTSLVGALTGAGQPDFVGILSGAGPFTVFAPTNNAFTDLNTELAPGGIAGVSAENLTKVLQYHVVSPANVLAASLTEGQVVNTLQTPQSFTVLLNGGARLKDANNRECPITATDVQAANGVIHVLSKVLLPTF
ncbi:fasciclin domain-containing protein [Flavobacterium sp. CYK-4]|uniref:fasciclin domain-containing protein n=1 Tax=Flavobacterium lotistagni TaxID=2709660 RepID=UPI0014077976|nr:fasciclin domain-containing protein [Flavobacterium lotistagni]NHM06181.1 fasciclin domain-containing protein [Flavobacterium lotistagni]